MEVTAGATIRDIQGRIWIPNCPTGGSSWVQRRGGGRALTSGGDQRRSGGAEQVGEEDATQLPAWRAWHGLALPGPRRRMCRGMGMNTGLQRGEG